MNTNMDLKEVERKSFRATMAEDGLFDFILSMSLLFMFSGPLIAKLNITWGFINEDLHILSIIIFLIAFILYILAKKYISEPRIGKVKFQAKRKMNLLFTSIVLTISVLLALGLMLLFHYNLISDSFLRTVPAVVIFFSLNVIIVFGLMAYFLDFPRMYLYAVLFIIPIVLGEIIKQSTRSIYIIPTLFMFSFLIALSISIYFFIRFLKKYPLPNPPEENYGK